jgi:hypothetical protein
MSHNPFHVEQRVLQTTLWTTQCRDLLRERVTTAGKPAGFGDLSPGWPTWLLAPPDNPLIGYVTDAGFTMRNIQGASFAGFDQIDRNVARGRFEAIEGGTRIDVRLAMSRDGRCRLGGMLALFWLLAVGAVGRAIAYHTASDAAGALICFLIGALFLWYAVAMRDAAEFDAQQLIGVLIDTLDAKEIPRFPE